MVTEPDDKWAYGTAAPSEPDVSWPPPPSEGISVNNAPLPSDGVSMQDNVPVNDTVRLSTGRWTSPSLGAYDSPVRAEDDPADPFGGGDDDDAYFNQFGYGDDYGDGSLQDSYGQDGGGDDDYDIDAELGAGDARRNAIEWAVVLVGAVLLALILRAVLLQAFWIPSPSMESTLLVRDRVLVNKISYNLHEIHRGDVIVFRRTEAEIASNPELPRDVIKRVIALEGETIEIIDNKVMIDGGELLEPYLDEDIRTDDFGPEEVPEGHVFVMGDNRGLSLDSRFETGPVSHDRVVGRAFFLFWPLDRLGSL